MNAGIPWGSRQFPGHNVRHQAASGFFPRDGALIFAGKPSVALTDFWRWS
jgi:hypothetical protein